MPFPYEKYEIVAEPFSVYFSESQYSLVHLIIQSVQQAIHLHIVLDTTQGMIGNGHS